MQIIVTKEITDEDISNLLSGCLTGSAYWAEIVKYEKPSDWNSDMVIEDYPLKDGAWIIQDNESDKPIKYRLDRAMINTGLQAFADSKEMAHHWKDVLSDNTDQVTGDCFLQFCLFGEVLYG